MLNTPVSKSSASSFRVNAASLPEQKLPDRFHARRLWCRNDWQESVIKASNSSTIQGGGERRAGKVTVRHTDVI
jgi:hypothetical protein